MKVARVLIDGQPRLAVVKGKSVHALAEATSSAAGHDLARGLAIDGIVSALRDLDGQAGQGVPMRTIRLLSPLAHPRKIVAIGRNYKEHAAEEGAELPTEPLVFAKFPSSIVGPGEEIHWDSALTSAVDYEAELAVVIGERASRVSRGDAMRYVFGYTCLNDVSARDLQFGDGQWVRGKSLDTFCPIGPWVVTTDEIPDPQNLSITCTVSGERLQASSTANMIFGVAELVHRLSYSFTLEPGDVIATGTPEGVGFFREPKRYLRPGDVVEVEIGGIGTLRNQVTA